MSTKRDDLKHAGMDAEKKTKRRREKIKQR
jgi:hypothetical protein